MSVVPNSRAVNSKALSEYIVPVLSGFLIVFGTAVPVLTIGCLLVHILYIIFMDSKATFKLLFTLLPFAQIYKVTALGGTSFFTYLEVLVCVVYLLRMKKIRWEFLIMFLAWAIYVLVGSRLDVLVWLKQAMIPLLLYIFFTNEKPRFREIVMSLTIGLLLSSTAGMFREQLRHLLGSQLLQHRYHSVCHVYADDVFLPSHGCRGAAAFRRTDLLRCTDGQ